METTIDALIRINGRKVHSVSADSSLDDALRVMAEYNIGAVVILDSAEALVGIFSERDYARASVHREQLSLETPIGELMTSEVMTVGPNQTVQECMELVTRQRIRHLPVVDKRGLIGLVSIGDLVKAAISEKEALIADKQALIQKLEGYISGTIV